MLMLELQDAVNAEDDGRCMTGAEHRKESATPTSTAALRIHMAIENGSNKAGRALHRAITGRCTAHAMVADLFPRPV